MIYIIYIRTAMTQNNSAIDLSDEDRELLRLIKATGRERVESLLSTVVKKDDARLDTAKKSFYDAVPSLNRTALPGFTADTKGFESFLERSAEYASDRDIYDFWLGKSNALSLWKARATGFRKATDDTEPRRYTYDEIIKALRKGPIQYDYDATISILQPVTQIPDKYKQILNTKGSVKYDTKDKRGNPYTRTLLQLYPEATQAPAGAYTDDYKNLNTKFNGKLDNYINYASWKARHETQLLAGEIEPNSVYVELKKYDINIIGAPPSLKYAEPDEINFYDIDPEYIPEGTDNIITDLKITATRNTKGTAADFKIGRALRLSGDPYILHQYTSSKYEAGLCCSEALKRWNYPPNKYPTLQDLADFFDAYPYTDDTDNICLVDATLRVIYATDFPSKTYRFYKVTSEHIYELAGYVANAVFACNKPRTSHIADEAAQKCNKCSFKPKQGGYLGKTELKYHKLTHETKQLVYYNSKPELYKAIAEYISKNNEIPYVNHSATSFTTDTTRYYIGEADTAKRNDSDSRALARVYGMPEYITTQTSDKVYYDFNSLAYYTLHLACKETDTRLPYSVTNDTTTTLFNMYDKRALCGIHYYVANATASAPSASASNNVTGYDATGVGNANALTKLRSSVVSSDINKCYTSILMGDLPYFDSNSEVINYNGEPLEDTNLYICDMDELRKVVPTYLTALLVTQSALSTQRLSVAKLHDHATTLYGCVLKTLGDFNLVHKTILAVYHSKTTNLHDWVDTLTSNKLNYKRAISVVVGKWAHRMEAPDFSTVIRTNCAELAWFYDCDSIKLHEHDPQNKRGAYRAYHLLTRKPRQLMPQTCYPTYVYVIQKETAMIFNALNNIHALYPSLTVTAVKCDAMTVTASEPIDLTKCIRISTKPGDFKLVHKTQPLSTCTYINWYNKINTNNIKHIVNNSTEIIPVSSTSELVEHISKLKARRIMILGGAGTGKSTAIKSIIPSDTLRLSFTNCISALNDGATIHKTLQLDIQQQTHAKDISSALEGYSCVWIDEIQTTPVAEMELIRLLQDTPKGSSMLWIMTGDFNQHVGVGSNLTACSKLVRDICGGVMYRLTTQLRIKDDDYNRLLLPISSSNISDNIDYAISQLHEAAKYLNSRFVDDGTCKNVYAITYYTDETIKNSVPQLNAHYKTCNAVPKYIVKQSSKELGLVKGMHLVASLRFAKALAMPTPKQRYTLRLDRCFRNDSVADTWSLDVDSLTETQKKHLYENLLTDGYAFSSYSVIGSTMEDCILYVYPPKITKHVTKLDYARSLYVSLTRHKDTNRVYINI